MTVSNNIIEIPRLHLLGVGSLETKALKRNVLLALQELGLNVILEEIEAFERLMEYDISGIPALAVGEDVVLEKEIPSVEALKDLLKPIFSSANNDNSAEEL